MITINTAEKTYVINYVDYHADCYDLNSPEGIQTLDYWFDRWTNIFANLKKYTNEMFAALSGGFDSRITFLLMLQSGINLDEIRITSHTDKLHTHEEDYAIACEIADYYKFNLNQNPKIPGGNLNYSLKDAVNISFYTKMGFHKELYRKTDKYEYKRFYIPGAGGESVRAHWDVPSSRFLKQNQNAADRYKKEVADEMKASVECIYREGFEAIQKKFHIHDEDSIQIPLDMHREIRCRSHFGKSQVEDYFCNRYTLSPLIDPDLRKIRLSDSNCQDNNLLMAMIYIRYCPKLLEFRFEGGRSIAAETIAYARTINERYPREQRNTFTENFSVILKDESVSRLLPQNNERLPLNLPDDFLRKVYDSVGCKKTFESCFDAAIYEYAISYSQKNNYFPLRHCYSVIAVTKVIEELLANELMLESGLYDNLVYLADQNAYKEGNKDRGVEKQNRIIKEQAQEIKSLKKQVKDYKTSASYRIGLKITAPARKVYRMVKKS